MNYVKDEILSQYNDKRVFHSITFYSKSMILAEINYHIYDKKLLVIIQCFKHWWLELKCIELFIQMFKFSNNFNIFLITSMILFYFNKEFHSWMSFDSDTTDYEMTCEWLEARKANSIVIWMKKLLNFNYQQLKKMKLTIEVQINKHRWNITYEVDDWVWLSFRNVKTTRLCKDLKDKQLNFY